MNLPKLLAAQPVLVGADLDANFGAIVTKLNGLVLPSDLAPGVKVPAAQRVKQRSGFLVTGRFLYSSRGTAPITNKMVLALPPISSFFGPADLDIRTVAFNARHGSATAMTGSITATRNGGQSSGAKTFTAVAAGKIYGSNQAWATTPPASGRDLLEFSVNITAPATVTWGEFFIVVWCTAKFAR